MTQFSTALRQHPRVGNFSPSPCSNQPTPALPRETAHVPAPTAPQMHCAAPCRTQSCTGYGESHGERCFVSSGYCSTSTTCTRTIPHVEHRLERSDNLPHNSLRDTIGPRQIGHRKWEYGPQHLGHHPKNNRIVPMRRSPKQTTLVVWTAACRQLLNLPHAANEVLDNRKPSRAIIFVETLARQRSFNSRVKEIKLRIFAHLLTMNNLEPAS